MLLSGFAVMPRHFAAHSTFTFKIVWRFFWKSDHECGHGHFRFFKHCWWAKWWSLLFYCHIMLGTYLVTHSAVVCLRWADFDGLWHYQRTGTWHLLVPVGAATRWHHLTAAWAPMTISIRWHGHVVVGLVMWPRWYWMTVQTRMWWRRCWYWHWPG